MSTLARQAKHHTAVDCFVSSSFLTFFYPIFI